MPVTTISMSAVADQRLGDVDDARRRHLRDEVSPRSRLADGVEDGVDRRVEAEQEARHLRQRDRDRPAGRDLILNSGITEPRDASTLP